MITDSNYYFYYCQPAEIAIPINNNRGIIKRKKLKKNCAVIRHYFDLFGRRGVINLSNYL